MNNRVQQSVLEERNLFPEKVAESLHIDADGNGAEEQAEDYGDVGLMEEISLEEMFGRDSSPIEDESPARKMRKPAVKPPAPGRKNRAFDVELLAREIDALKKTDPKRTQDARSEQVSDFWKVLADEDQKLIDEVTRKADEVELEMLEPVAAIDADENDRAYFISNTLEGSGRPLSEDTKDFYITAVEGYRGLGPDTIIDHISRKIASAKKTSIEEKPVEMTVSELEPIPGSEPMLELASISEPMLEPETTFESGGFIDEPGHAATMLDLDEIVTDDAGIASTASMLDKKGSADDLFASGESVHFPISDDDLHDVSIADELAILAGTDSVSHPSEIIDESEDEVLRLSPDELQRVSEDNDGETEFFSPTDDIGKEMPVDDEAPIPDNFILTPVDLLEAERIAKEEVLLFSEKDLIEELETSDIFQNDAYDDIGSRKIKQKRNIDEKKIDVRYAIPEGSSLSESHKASIEDDITSAQALVIEEDIAEIRKRYKTGQNAGAIEEPVDITDQVIILDDEEDVDRVAKTLPDEKRGDMMRLFKYLDGLFEKLPTDVVRSFADSEYFDLYVKIMNDNGK
jgi:hypothetical protein